MQQLLMLKSIKISLWTGAFDQDQEKKMEFSVLEWTLVEHSPGGPWAWMWGGALLLFRPLTGIFPRVLLSSHVLWSWLVAPVKSKPLVSDEAALWTAVGMETTTTTSALVSVEAMMLCLGCLLWGGRWSCIRWQRQLLWKWCATPVHFCSANTWGQSNHTQRSVTCIFQDMGRVQWSFSVMAQA